MWDQNKNIGWEVEGLTEARAEVSHVSISEQVLTGLGIRMLVGARVRAGGVPK